MNDIRARLARLERIARAGGSVVVVSLRGLSERMRRARDQLRGQQQPRRSPAELEAALSSLKPESIAHKMAARALRRHSKQGD
jgi:hypothetical protein